MLQDRCDEHGGVAVAPHPPKVMPGSLADSRIGGTAGPGARQRGHPPPKDAPVTPSSASHPSLRALRVAAATWYVAAILGQAAFAAFILAFVVPRLMAGDLPGLNDKPHITGYVPGDAAGNANLLAHLLVGAVMTLSAMLQLLPALRRRWPGVHRWNGRAFMVAAAVATLTGFYLTWVRGSQLTLPSAMSTSINGVLILLALGLAWRAARARDMVQHRRHALRAFLLVNGVWFLRLGIVPVAMGLAAAGQRLELDGALFLAISIGSWAIPLAVLELYFVAERARSDALRWATAALVVVLAVITAAAGAAAWMGMWAPRL